MVGSVGYFSPKALRECRDPNNLPAMLWTWQNGNVGATPGRGFNGDQVAALKTIKAKMIVLPALKDLCFPLRTRSSRSATSRTPNCAPFQVSTATSRGWCLSLPIVQTLGQG
jgi:hypothetical protein